MSNKTPSQQAAKEISIYLLTGMHHTTTEGQISIAGIIARHLHAQATEQAKFWEECTRDALRDKEQHIKFLTR